jgi:hypothetical protein
MKIKIFLAVQFLTKRLAVLIALIAGLFLFSSNYVESQAVPSQPLLYAWQTPTGTGQLGQYIILVQNQKPASGNYTIDWSLSGTAPVACTFRVEGSFDNVNWFGLDTTSPSSTSCTTSNMESIAYKPVFYLRINIVTWTNGDATTKAIFHFTGANI